MHRRAVVARHCYTGFRISPLPSIFHFFEVLKIPPTGTGWAVKRLQHSHGGALSEAIGGRPVIKNNLMQVSKWAIAHCCGLRTRSHHSSWYPISPTPSPSEPPLQPSHSALGISHPRPAPCASGSLSPPGPPSSGSPAPKRRKTTPESRVL